MPSKKKKYNARFPPARIKKIMQKDEDVGKVAAPVPVLISKALEIFVEGLITKASEETLSRNAKTLTTSHIKQCIEQENKFDFLKDLVENVPTISCEDDDSNNSGSVHADKPPNSRRKRGLGRDASAQSSIQSVDEPSSEEDSFDSDDSDSKDERQRHPAETSGASTSNSSSTSSSHPALHSVPQAHYNSFPYPGQTASGVTFPPAMPPPLLPPQQSAPTGYAPSGNTPAMGAYVMPHPHPSQNNSNEDSDEDYDA